MSIDPSIPTIVNINQKKLLEAVINLTMQHDQDNLALSFLTETARLFSLSHLSLYLLTDSNTGTSVEEILCLSADEIDGKEKKYICKQVSQPVKDNKNILMAFQQQEFVWASHSDSCVLLPLTNASQVISIYPVDNKENLSDHLSLLEKIIQIYENCFSILTEVEKDSLTGLRNRKTFDNQLGKLLARQDIAKRKRAELYFEKCIQTEQNEVTWLVAIDIDHFKRINDAFGHLYGDEILLLLSQIMTKYFRRTDLLFRFGGEEFVIILAATSEKNAYLVLNRFRNVIADYNFPQVGQVTISIGYAQINKGDFPPTILDKADKALYFSKENGRNQVCGYERLINEGKLTDEATNVGDSELF